MHRVCEKKWSLQRLKIVGPTKHNMLNRGLKKFAPQMLQSEEGLRNPLSGPANKLSKIKLNPFLYCNVYSVANFLRDRTHCEFELITKSNLLRVRTYYNVDRFYYVKQTFQESHFGQHKWPEPGAMSVRFFRDFYRLDSSHVRTHDFEKYPKMLHKYQSLNRSVGVWDIFDAGWHCR